MIVPHYNNKQPLGVTSLVVLTAKALFLTLVMTAVVSLMFLVSVFMARPATATTMNPASMVDWIATANYDYLNGYLAGSPCTSTSHHTQSPAVTRWIASSYHPKVTSVTVPYGTASVDLKFHLAGSQCWNSVGVDTYSVIQSISASAGSISPTLPDPAILRMNFALPTSAGRTLMSSSGVFTYTPTGGFTTSGTHIVTVYAKEGNVFSNGARRCVADGANANNYFSNCPTGASTLSIYVAISNPDSPPNLAIYTDCTAKTVTIQANDANAGNLGMGYMIYQDGNPVPGSWTTPTPATIAVASNTTASGYQATWVFNMAGYDQSKKWLVRAYTVGVAPNGGTPPLSSLRAVESSYGSCPDNLIYPWLQTTAGNVVANGKITGHSASDTLPGSRATTNTEKEAEFLIISKVGGPGPFCSRKNYILTNASATGGTDCGNGSGYSVLNVVSVAGTEDKVVAGVKAAYDTLGPACQRITDTVNNIVTNVPDSCTDGAIVKYSGTSLTGYSLTKGRVTILVEGDLTIGVGVGYGNTGYDNPKDVPNLVIVVKGDVTVLGAATLVGASIYATGTISTCDTAPTTFCSSQLVINGFLSAQSGFIFGRGFTDTTARTAAEIVNLTLQSVVYPPPGIDYSSVFKGDSSAKIDSSEYQPRF